MEEEIVVVGAGAPDSPLPEDEGAGRLGAVPYEENQHIRQHIENLQQQSRAFRQTLPEFDLKKELHDPMFARLTSPLVGLSVEDAYYALHRKEMQQQAARITAAGLSRSIQAGRMRPEENRGNQAASVTKLNYANASRQQREELKKEIRRAAALGEKVYP